MIKTILLLLAGVVGMQAATPYWPTDFVRFHYYAFTCPSLDQGATCISGAPETPSPNVWVTILVSPITGSGQHTHEAQTQVNRPPVVFFDGARKQTNSAGLVDFTIEFNGWAGTYNVYLVPEVGPGGYTYKTTFDQIETKVETNDKNGNKVPLQVVKFGPYAAAPQVDSRHIADGTGNSMYVTKACNGAFAAFAYNYNTDFQNPNGFKVIPMRGSLSKGGKADNQIDINWQYLFQLPWLVQEGEWHPSGISLDFANFGYLAGSNPTNQNLQFTLALNAGRKAGVRPSRMNELGNLVDAAHYPGGETVYWFGRPSVHMVCQREAVYVQ